MASFATQVQIRRGTEAENDAFTGAEGEVTMDLTNKQLRVHDGQTTGGMKIPNINTVFGTSQIQDGAITESKLSADLQTKINEKTSGAGRNIGDIFWTTRTDSALNGAVEANGAQYNFADVNGGDNNVQALLESGALPSVTIAEFDTKVASDGGCDAFGYDAGAAYFKVPKKTPRILVRCQKPTADNNYTWFNVYADGWVEQGGIDATARDNNSITLPVQMSGGYRTYAVSVNAGVASSNARNVQVLDTSTATILNVVTNAAFDVFWQVSGYADATEYTPDKWDYQNVQVERPMVQLFNSATDEAVAQCTEVLSDVAGLKQTTDGMIDYVIERQEPTAENGYTWYRLYKSGWVEQGGGWAVRPNGTAVAFPITISSIFTFLFTNGGVNMYRFAAYPTSTGFVIGDANSGSNNKECSWSISGMSAQ